MTVGYKSAFIQDYFTVVKNGRIDNDNGYSKALKNMFVNFDIPSDILLYADNDGNIYNYNTKELLTPKA